MASEEALKKRIKELEETIAILEKDLIHDELTGLKTKAYFEEEARVYFDVAVNSGSQHGPRRRQWFGFSQVSFIFFDIDDFKRVNDSLGHQAGDDVLKAVAETMKTSVRDGDTAARWGGDEMAITLVGATERDAFHKAEDIRRQVESIHFGKYPDLKVTLSAGISSATSTSTFEETLDHADKALYEAKRKGKNLVVTYSETLRT